LVFAGGTVNLTGQVYGPKAALYLLGNHNLNIGGSAALGITGGLVLDKLYSWGSGRVNVDATPYQLTDLSITMGDTGNATLIPGDLGSWLEYYVTVTNNGSTTVHGAKVSDIFPSSFDDYGFRAFPSDGAQSQLVYPYEFGYGFTGNSLEDTVTMAPGSSIEYEITGDAGPNGSGMFVNTATVTPPPFTVDTNPADNTAIDSHPLNREADLSVSIGDGVPAASPGNAVAYTISAVLGGPSAYQHAVLSDTVPSSIASFTVTGSNGFTAQGHGGDTFSDTSLGFTGGEYGQEVYYTLTAVISPTASGTLSNTVSIAPPDGVTDINPSDNSATDSDIIAPPADLAVSVDDGVTSAVAGTGITYTITVTNNGPTDVVGAEVVDHFPAGLSGPLILSNSPTNPGGGGIIVYGGTLDFSGSSNSGPITGIIDNNGSLTGPFDLNLGGGTTILDGGTLTLNNAAASNNVAVASSNAAVASPAAMTPAPVINSATFGSGTTTFSGGTTVNTGSSGSITIGGGGGYLPYLSGITSDSYTAIGTGGATGFTSGTGDIDDFVNLPSGASIVYTVAANIGPYGNLLSDTATVTPPNTVADPNLGNNNATETTPLTSVTDLAITQTDDTDTVYAGLPTTYTIVVSNTGPSTAANVSVADVFPVGIDSDTYTADLTGGASFDGFPGESTRTSGSTSSGSGNINDEVNLPPGATITYHVTAQVDLEASGDLTNTATIGDTFPLSDTNLSNNTSTSTRSIVEPNDLRVTVSTDAASATAGGDSITYTVTVSNTGTQNVNAAQVMNTVYIGGAYTVNGNLHIQRSETSSDQFTATGTAGTSGFTASGSGNINDIVNIPAGGSITYLVTTSAPANAPGGNDLGDAAMITPPSTFTDMINYDNVAYDQIVINEQSDISVAVTDDAGASSITGATGSAAAGGSVVYTMVVTNNGPSEVTSVDVSASLVPGTYTFQLLDAQGDPAYSPYPNILISGYWIYSPLPSGASETFIITAQVDPTFSGPMVTTFSAYGSYDPVPDNNSASITDNISAS
ncbi:MAG TPA: hypothetical protein VMJ32_03510, partial [Pirellulales bacterium]|nr:hypothetical protein [Pirellulales bacterium]